MHAKYSVENLPCATTEEVISLVKSMQWSRRLGKNLGAFIFN